MILLLINTFLPLFQTNNKFNFKLKKNMYKQIKKNYHAAFRGSHNVLLRVLQQGR